VLRCKHYVDGVVFCPRSMLGVLDALFLDIPKYGFFFFSGFVTPFFCVSSFFPTGYYAVHPTKAAQLPI